MMKASGAWVGFLSQLDRAHEAPDSPWIRVHPIWSRPVQGHETDLARGPRLDMLAKPQAFADGHLQVPPLDVTQQRQELSVVC